MGQSRSVYDLAFADEKLVETKALDEVFLREEIADGTSTRGLIVSDNCTVLSAVIFEETQ